MKKAIISVLTATAITCAVQTSFAANFTDLTESRYNWCAPQIEKMSKAGYVNGYEDNTYRPDNQVTKLECIALFARAMGSKDEANERVLEMAHSQYDSAISTASLSWGDDEIAYMMYKGAFTLADVTTYLKDKVKDEPMTRGEAAVIITKAMGGDVSSASNGVSLSYSDAREIPSNLLQYIKFVSDEGIMNGMDDGSFNADGSVTRAQIAVMLERVVSKCDYKFESARISKVDTENDLITIDGSDGKKEYPLENVKCYIKGSHAMSSDLPDNVAAVVQYSGDELYSVDAMSEDSDVSISAVYSGYSTTGKAIIIKVKESGSETVKSYTTIDNVPITYEGSPATIKSFKAGDTVTLEIADGKVQAITGAEKSIKIEGATVTEAVMGETDFLITISSAVASYDGMTYPVSSEVSVQKNGDIYADLTDIYPGDKVTLTVQYGKIVKIIATSTRTTVSGTLVSLNIAEQPSIVVKSDGKNKTFTIPVDCKIYVNDKEATLYDFRVGDSMVLTVDSEAVVDIRCSTSAVTTANRVTGTVYAINKSYGCITVTEETTGIPVQVFCKTANFIDEMGKTLSMDKIKVGDVIESRGTTKNGAFTATLIIVTAAE